jgi:hypothetical protein
MHVNLCPVSELAGPDTHLPAIGPTYYQNADFIIKNPNILSKTALLLSKTQIYYQIPFYQSPSAQANPVARLSIAPDTQNE